jgi:hypothetical protein
MTELTSSLKGELASLKASITEQDKALRADVKLLLSESKKDNTIEVVKGLKD